MLVLARRLGESIFLPDLNVTVTVIGISRGKVRLGITAPRDIQIERSENITDQSPAPAEDAK